MYLTKNKRPRPTTLIVDLRPSAGISESNSGNKTVDNQKEIVEAPSPAKVPTLTHLQTRQTVVSPENFWLLTPNATATFRKQLTKME